MFSGRAFFFRIFLTVLGAMLPLLALHVVRLHAQFEAAREDVYREVVDRANGAAEQIGLVLSRGEQVLELLAKRAEVRSLDAARCTQTLAGMVAIDPLYVNIAVADMNGDIVCASVAGEGRLPLRTDRARWIAAVDANGLYLGEPMAAGPLLGRPAAVLSLPVRDDAGRTVAMIAIALDLIGMADRLLTPGLPEGGSVTLVSAQGTIVTRYPQAADYVGRPLPHSVRQAREAQPEGVLQALGPDSVPRIYSKVDLPRHGLRVSAGIPVEVAFADVQATQRRALMVAALTVALAMAVAFYAAHWLSAPLQSLARTARGWARGQRELRADERLPGEFAALATEFNAMMEAREASEGRLRESERRYAELLEEVDMLAVTLSHDGRISYCNDAVVRLSGWPREALVGSLWASRFVAADGPQAIDLSGGSTGEGRSSQSETHLVTREGGRRLIRWVHTLRRDDAGRVVGSSAIGEDVTERREVERAREASAQAAAANLAKTDFLARMSHELRTPLNAVLGFSQLLQASAGTRLTQAERRQLDMVFMGGEQLRALIDDILDVSRIEAGHMTVDAVDVPLAELLDGVLRLSEAAAGPSGIELVPAYEGRTLPTLRTDPLRLRQVLLNLVSNGIKYNRPGGQVALDVVVEEASGRATSRVHIVVRDTGLGMTPEQLATLFEPYNRLGRERSDIAGTGIGMMLSRQLVQLLGGQMQVLSAPDQGTTIEVLLPQSSDPSLPVPPPGGPAAVQATQTLPAGRVLYIEDNATNAVLVQQLLSRWPDVSLTIAPDGTCGVREAERLQPDLVLLDMQLPDIDGLRVLELLRQRPPTRGLRVVVLSASAMPTDVEQALHAGAIDYWTKPIEFGSFLERLAGLLAAPAPPGGMRERGLPMPLAAPPLQAPYGDTTMPNEKPQDTAANPDRQPLPGRRDADDAPDASRGSGPSNRDGLKRPRPVDLAEESAAGEEDPGAGLDVSTPRSPDAPDKV